MHVDLESETSLAQLYSTGYLEELILNGKYLATLHEIVQSKRKLAWVAERSYFHINGFEKIVIGECHSMGRRIVLHRWNLAVRDEEIEIHNHRWNFISYVIQGGLESRAFVIVKTANELFHHYRYSSPGILASYSLEYVGDVRLAESNRGVYSQGMSYYQPRDEVHGAVVTAAEAETLVIQDNATRQYTDVFSKLKLRATKRQVTRFAAALVQRTLQECIDRLEE